MINNKEALRKEMLFLRKNIPNKDIKSKTITDKIINLELFSKSKVIGIYKSLPDEVNLELLINYALKCGKKVLVPKIINNEIKMILINSNTKFLPSNFKVLEPIDNNIYHDKIDLILIPGVAFDKKKNRLGFGKGYYDRYLEKNQTYKIGICFKEQIIDNLITNSFDIPMDLIIND